MVLRYGRYCTEHVRNYIHKLHIECAIETDLSFFCKKCSHENTKPAAAAQPQDLKNSGLLGAGTSELGTCNTCFTRGTYGVDGFTGCRECYWDVCNGCSRIYDERIICIQCRREKIQHPPERDSTIDGTYSESTTVAHASGEESDGEVKDELNDDDLKKLLKHETKPPHKTTLPTEKPNTHVTPSEAINPPDDGWQTAKLKKNPRAQEPAARDDKPQKILSPNGLRKSNRLKSATPKTS